MNKNITLNVANSKTTNGAASLYAVIVTIVVSPYTWLNGYFSQIIGRPLNGGNTLLILIAQIAFVLTVFAETSVPMRIITLTCLIGTLIRLRQTL